MSAFGLADRAPMRKFLPLAAAAACLALPALAAGEDHARAVDHITCGDGTVLTPPFSAPVCAGHGAVASISCASGVTITTIVDGTRCPEPGDDDQASSATPPSAAPPAESDDDGTPSSEEHGQHGEHGHDGPLAPAFLNGIWRVTGSGNGFADGVLDFTADRFLGLPRRLAKQDDAFVGNDSRVLVTAGTRVYDADKHRLAGAAEAAALDDADDVVVTGKVVPRAKWLHDEDDVPVPTLRAKRIAILS